MVWSPCSPRDSQESFPTPQFKSINSSALNFLYSPTLTSIHEKAIALTWWTFVSKVVSLLFGSKIMSLMLSRLVIGFLPRRKCLSISWLKSIFAVILEPKKIKSVTVSIIFPSIWHEVMGPDAMILAFWMLSLKEAFSLSSHFHQVALQFLFTICYKSGVICISEVMDISPSNLDSSFASSSLVFHMMSSAYNLSKQGDSIHPWCTSGPNLEPVCCSISVLTFVSWTSYRYLRS